jgi:hypothetical protein
MIKALMEQLQLRNRVTAALGGLEEIAKLGQILRDRGAEAFGFLMATGATQPAHAAAMVDHLAPQLRARLRTLSPDDRARATRYALEAALEYAYPLVCQGIEGILTTEAAPGLMCAIPSAPAAPEAKPRTHRPLKGKKTKNETACEPQPYDPR